MYMRPSIKPHASVEGTLKIILSLLFEDEHSRPPFGGQHVIEGNERMLKE